MGSERVGEVDAAIGIEGNGVGEPRHSSHLGGGNCGRTRDHLPASRPGLAGR